MSDFGSFSTLELAQAHEEPVERMVSPDMVISLLTAHDSVVSLKTKAVTDDKAAGFLLALTGSVTDFNLMNSHPVGIAQQGLLTYLVSIEAVSQSFKEAIISYANYVTYPHAGKTQADFDEAKDTGETITLTANNNQHKIKLSISTKPRKTTDIIIQQRFGLTNQNLTDWVEVGRVRGVEYTTDHIAFYESGMIPKSPAAYRELQAVCALTLGIEQVID